MDTVTRWYTLKILLNGCFYIAKMPCTQVQKLRISQCVEICLWGVRLWLRVFENCSLPLWNDISLAHKWSCWGTLFMHVLLSAADSNPKHEWAALSAYKGSQTNYHTCYGDNYKVLYRKFSNFLLSLPHSVLLSPTLITSSCTLIV